MVTSSWPVMVSFACACVVLLFHATAYSQDQSSQIHVLRLDNPGQFAKLKKQFESLYPHLTIRYVEVDGETSLRCEQDGLRVFCLCQGEGEVFLPQGYRTQEGDGKGDDGRLPDSYLADEMDPELAELLRRIRGGIDTLSEKALGPTQAILGRQKGGEFVGDIAGELWRLEEQAARPWSSDKTIEAALEQLFTLYREHGFSTKQADSWEPIMVGDQLIARGTEAVRVRGAFRCFTVENRQIKTTHVSTARRLRYLLDTAGGCSPGFDPFRRLPLTWFANYPGEEADGINFFNSHIVNIPAESSPTHFHPEKPDVGMPQAEMYLVLDPAAYDLSTAGLPASITLYPDLSDLTQYEEHDLEPGMFVFIPPGTGHRGLNVFVNVMTVPGFKPHNECYLDRDIHDRTQGKSPYNEAHLGSKNYEKLEDFLP